VCEKQAVHACCLSECKSPRESEKEGMMEEGRVEMGDKELRGRKERKARGRERER